MPPDGAIIFSDLLGKLDAAFNTSNTPKATA
jgi:hypothetical protein